MQDCERDRQVLAYTDLYQEFMDLMDVANRANVGIYPVDARGLAATDRPLGMDQGTPAEESRRVQTRVEYLRSLAENTDGLAVLNTNDIDRGLRRIVADMTSYYLVGYSSKNAKLDGRFRKITVRVKRPGVDVRARRGYQAATADELRPPPSSAANRAGPPPGVQAALSSMAVARAASVRTAVSFVRRGQGPSGPIRAWATVELDAASVRRDFARGGDLSVIAAGADGSALGQGRAIIQPGTRAARVDLGEVVTAGADLVVRARVKPKDSDGAAITDIATVPAAAQQGASALLWRRGPGSAAAFVPTADVRFTRAERVRADVLIAASESTVTASLLDRAGGETAVPVAAATHSEAGQSWATAELALAPLAPADYVLKMTVSGPDGPVEVFTAIRVVP
jgi:hypothetical protein